jgi:ribosome-binding ATPase YchF (GTP1/OBG family)
MTELDARTKLRMVRTGLVEGSPTMLVYNLATAALAESDAEIARLKDELAESQNRAVLHATGAQCEVIIASAVADAEEPGTLLRSTDDTRTWERTAAGWQLR